MRLEGREKYYGPQRLILGRRKPDHSRPDEEIFEFGDVDHSWDLEWRHFLDVIKTGNGKTSDMLDGLYCQQMVEAAYKSAEEGRKIKFPNPEEKA
jgi:predicted dehydrogenase